MSLALITEDAEEGFALALSLSRKSVKAIQPDEDMRNALRKEYAEDAGGLIAASAVVAQYFSAIAAANDYWR